jgi:rare lipoprotein A
MCRHNRHARKSVAFDRPRITGLSFSQYPARHWSAHLIIFAFCFAFIFSGCSARKPAVADRQPPPADPSVSSSGAGESAHATSPYPPPSKSTKRRKAPYQPAPVGYTEVGEASWYGAPFHGRRASNGEIYDMNKLTAAHRTLPFETMVRVTNQKNGKSTVVRITDRGPFVNNRVIDLSYAAAREIDSVGPGVVPVRVEVLSAGIDPELGFFTIQVGSFRERANAERLRDRLVATYTPVSIKRYDTNGGLYRVHVGKISGEEAAKELSERLRSREGLLPMVVRLDESDSSAKGTP